MISSSLKYSDEMAESGDYFEVGEFLYSAAEILRKIDPSNSLKLFKHNIKIWKKLIKHYKFQAKLHEIAEINLKIADIYSEKFQNHKKEKFYILESINFLQQETDLLKEFNQSRTLVQNYQNIAELYFRISSYKSAISFYEKVIAISEEHCYYNLFSYSFQQIASCYMELDDYNKAKEIFLKCIEYFSILCSQFEEKNENLAMAQMCQILIKLYEKINDKEQIINYSKKEANAYINLAENLEKTPENSQKIARYYRGAGLCYQEGDSNNLIEVASCFVLAGNFYEKNEEHNEAGLNYFDAANIFKELKNWEMTYKYFIKAGDNYWKAHGVNLSTESYLNAYEIAVEVKLKFNRFGLFNQIIRALNKVAKESLKNKQFYTSATLILESIKFYEQLDIVQDFILRELVRNVYRYYYRAANLKVIRTSHIVHSYVLASISCILIGKLDKAREIISEIKTEGKTVNNYKEIIRIMIDTVSQKKKITIERFPYHLSRLIDSSEEITYLLNLHNRF